MAAPKASKTNCILRGFNLVMRMFKVKGNRADALVRFERNKSSGKRFDAAREIKGKETTRPLESAILDEGQIDSQTR